MKKLDLRKKEDDNKSRILNRETISEFRKESKYNTLEIMKKDIRSAFTNPIVMIVLLGVILLPSLYGLVNIYACWDPYENTGNVQFAIANDDNGTIYDGETPCVVSPMYSVFKVTNTEKVLPEYLMLWFGRTEFQRYTWYHASGSVRDTFDFNLMKEVEFPLPSIVIMYSPALDDELFSYTKI